MSAVPTRAASSACCCERASEVTCVFCEEAGGEVLWSDNVCRAVWTNDTDHPALCRVIWHEHIRDMHDLTEAQRMHLMRVVFAVESALVEALAPDKMNLASLGNQVPHLHWHVVPRFVNDPHFPSAIWAPKLRPGSRHVPADFPVQMRAALERMLRTDQLTRHL
jgi:diadenosine tetraphosphate (Ap4A) HIT family hydrolase